MTFVERIGIYVAGAATLLTLAGPATAEAATYEPLGTERVGHFATYKACDNARIRYLHGGWKVSTRCFFGSAYYFEVYT